LWPKLFDTWAWRGFLNQDKRLWDKCISDFNKCLELNPRYWEGWWTRGAARARLTRWQDAIADYGKAAEMNPQNADFHSDRAQLLATCPDAKLRDLRGAVAAARAVELAPQLARLWTNLGIYQYRAEAWKEAVQSLRKSDELLGGKEIATNGFYLAMAHWQLARKTTPASAMTGRWNGWRRTDLGTRSFASFEPRLESYWVSKRRRIDSPLWDGFAKPSHANQRKAAGGDLTAKQTSHRPGIAPALGVHLIVRKSWRDFGRVLPLIGSACAL